MELNINHIQKLILNNINVINTSIKNLNNKIHVMFSQNINIMEKRLMSFFTIINAQIEESATVLLTNEVMLLMNEILNKSLQCKEIWNQVYGDMEIHVQQFLVDLSSVFKNIQDEVQDISDKFLSINQDITKLSEEMDKRISQNINIGSEEKTSEASEDFFDFWMSFSKLAVVFAIELAKEEAELKKNINALGEEKGKAASGDGVMDKAAVYQYDTEKSNAEIQQVSENGILEWINQVQTFQDEVEKANEAVDASYLTLFTNMGTGIGTFFSDWGTKISTLKTDSTLANEEVSLVYSTMFTNMGTGVGDFFTGWKEKINTFKTDNDTANGEIQNAYGTMFGNIGTNLSTWVSESVSPWFTEEKWKTLTDGMKVGISGKWLSITAWWNENGMLSEVSVTFNDFLGNIKKAWKILCGWWDKDKSGLDDLKLGIKVPELKIKFDEEDKWAEVFQVFGLAGTPKFSFDFKTYATGGFPEDGWFRASHGEIMGRFDNGQSVVANNMQITEGIARGVRNANSEQNILLREQNALLRQILAKDNGISTRSIFEAVRTENRNYIHRNGQSAFV